MFKGKEKYLMYFDDHRFRTEMRGLEDTRSELNQVLQAIPEGLEIDYSIENLKRVLRGGSNALKEIIAEKMKPNSFFGIKQSPRKVVDTLDLTGTEQLDTISKEHRSDSFWATDEYLEVKDGEVVFVEGAENKMTERFKRYAETPDQKKKLKALQNFVKACEHLQECGFAVFSDTSVGHFVNIDSVFHDGDILGIREDTMRRHANLKIQKQKPGIFKMPKWEPIPEPDKEVDRTKKEVDLRDKG